MDEVSAHARMADEGVETPLVVSVPRTGIEQALEEDGADLVLDVVRSNGQREERRVSLALDHEALKRLIEQGSDPVAIALDPESLAVAFDDVETHGLREVGATLAIAVAAVGGAAGMANAAVDQGGAGAAGDPPTFQAFQTDFPVTQAVVVDQAGLIDAARGSEMAAMHEAAGKLAPEAGMPRAMPADYAAGGLSMDEARLAAEHQAPGNLPTPRDMPSEAVAQAVADNQAAERAAEQQMPRAMPSDYAAAAADEGGAQLRRDPGAVSNVPAVSEPGDRGIEAVRAAHLVQTDPTSAIENVRASQPTPQQIADPHSGIENVRIGAPMVPDPNSAIEQVRTQRAPVPPSQGANLSAPEAGVVAAIAGGALLALIGAAFVLRRKGEAEPQPA